MYCHRFQILFQGSINPRLGWLGLLNWGSVTRITSGCIYWNFLANACVHLIAVMCIICVSCCSVAETCTMLYHWLWKLHFSTRGTTFLLICWRNSFSYNLCNFIKRNIVMSVLILLNCFVVITILSYFCWIVRLCSNLYLHWRPCWCWSANQKPPAHCLLMLIKTMLLTTALYHVISICRFIKCYWICNSTRSHTLFSSHFPGQPRWASTRMPVFCILLEPGWWRSAIIQQEQNRSDTELWHAEMQWSGSRACWDRMDNSVRSWRYDLNQLSTVLRIMQDISSHLSNFAWSALSDAAEIQHHQGVKLSPIQCQQIGLKYSQYSSLCWVMDSKCWLWDNVIRSADVN